MGKIYTNQSRLKIYISTGSNLIEASSVYINGTEPDGSAISPQLTTTIEDADTGLVSFELGTYYLAPSFTFTAAGTWILWVEVAYIGGKIAYGEPFHLNVYAPGT